MGERVRSDQVSDPNKVYGSIPSARGASPGMVQGAVWAETLQGDGDPPRELRQGNQTPRVMGPINGVLGSKQPKLGGLPKFGC